MRIAPFLLFCFLILICTGWLDRTLYRLRVEKGVAAAICTLLLFLTPFLFEIGNLVYVQPASLLLLVIAAARPGKRRDAWLTLAAAAISGVASYLLYRLLPGFFEPGLLLALPQAIIGRLLFGFRRPAVLCCAAAPFFLSLLTAAEDLLLFGAFVLSAGSKLLLDIQLCGLALLLIFDWIAGVCKRFGVLRKMVRTMGTKNA